MNTQKPGSQSSSTQNSSSRRPKSHRNRKIAAIAAGLLVVGVGATYTLASWTDSEWVWGGADGAPGIGTSEFNVQQNAVLPYNADNFTDFETNPGDELTFSTGALSLTPGDSVYAPVALRTEEDSLGAMIQLKGAVAAFQPDTSTPVVVNDPNGDLWKNVTASVYTATGATPPTTCDTSFAPESWTQVLNDQALETPATATQTLLEDAGSVQHYCFVLTMNSTLDGGSTADSIDDLQGRTIAPAWEFSATSVAP